MKTILKGFSYAFNRNIGWQDRMIRTLVFVAATGGAFYFHKVNFTASIILSVLAVAQLWTVLSARCIICYFIGQCTISSGEKIRLESKGVKYES